LLGKPFNILKQINDCFSRQTLFSFQGTVSKDAKQPTPGLIQRLIADDNYMNYQINVGGVFLYRKTNTIYLDKDN
jgi:hypothetical protein